MPSLKDLRVRIRSVKSTQKITAAMKMVAASRLRRAQDQAEAARPYASRMERMLASLAANLKGQPNASRLLGGTGSEAVHLLVVATSDRGLAGGVNATILRDAPRQPPGGKDGEPLPHRPQGPRQPAPRLQPPHRREPHRGRSAAAHLRAVA